MNPNNKKEDKPSNNLIINESSLNFLDDIKIQDELKTKTVELIEDTGSRYSYIQESEIERLQLQPEETKPHTMVFGNGNRETTHKIFNKSIKLNNKSYNIKFYVLKNIPVKFILGYEFLYNNEAIINIKRKIIIFANGQVVPFLQIRCHRKNH